MTVVVKYSNKKMNGGLTYPDARVCVCACVCAPLHAVMYIPSCDEDGYYRKVQCDQSQGECWCVDQHGGEMAGTRIHGNPDCGKRGSFRKLHEARTSPSCKGLSLCESYVLLY